MDPNATLRLWATALAENDLAMAQDMARDLVGWLEKGGFRPKMWATYPEAEAMFIGWCDMHLGADTGAANVRKKDGLAV